jgi:hypothetical protein
MSQFFSHKGLAYELVEKQGFYHCLVYDKGHKRVLYQTEYFGSEERARSKAMLFIQDYIAHEEAKLLKRREEARIKAEKKRKKEEKRASGRSPEPRIEKGKQEVQTPEPYSTAPIGTSLYPPEDITPTPVPSHPEQVRTTKDVKPKETPRRGGDRVSRCTWGDAPRACNALY